MIIVECCKIFLASCILMLHLSYFHTFHLCTLLHENNSTLVDHSKMQSDFLKLLYYDKTSELSKLCETKSAQKYIQFFSLLTFKLLCQSAVVLFTIFEIMFCHKYRYALLI